MVRLVLQFTPMQFSDGPRAKARDARRIFRTFAHVRAGTESGEGRAEPLNSLLRAQAVRRGHKFFGPKRKSGCWIAVDKKLIDKGSWVGHFTPVLPPSSRIPGSRRAFGPRGVVWGEFTSKALGGRRVTVICGHYIINAAHPDSAQLNSRIARKVGDIARSQGKGRGIVLYLGDQNTNDRKHDTFMGSPMTSIADELEDWQFTTDDRAYIDVIASYDLDKQVTPVAYYVLDDTEFKTDFDHRVSVGVYEVKT